MSASARILRCSGAEGSVVREEDGFVILGGVEDIENVDIGIIDTIINHVVPVGNAAYIGVLQPRKKRKSEWHPRQTLAPQEQFLDKAFRP